MSSRVGPTCLLVGVILIGAAAVLATAVGPAERATAWAPPALSTGFLVWSLTGALGLLVGMIASQRGRRSAAGVPTVLAKVPTGASVPADRFRTVFEHAEDPA